MLHHTQNEYTGFLGLLLTTREYQLYKPLHSKIYCCVQSKIRSVSHNISSLKGIKYHCSQGSKIFSVLKTRRGKSEFIL